MTPGHMWRGRDDTMAPIIEKWPAWDEGGAPETRLLRFPLAMLRGCNVTGSVNRQNGLELGD